jgi:hypothetical protein
MRTRLLTNVLIGSAAVLAVGAHWMPGTDQSGPVLTKAVAFVSPKPVSSSDAAASTVSSRVAEAIGALGSAVRPLSNPSALDDAFRAYFAYKTEHPADVKKPYLYFVDYGLSSTTQRGYVFDMDALKIVDGPFMVAHGRGSSTSQYGVPTHFSNASGSEATSLGLYLTQSTYGFHGHTGGQSYSSIGLQLLGLSDGFNTNALARRVVVHGAPYVTPTRAGRSEGCPAMEPSRAQELLPKLANGSMVFLFAPNQAWMAGDPWIAATSG